MRAVVLLSGGLDSTVALAICRHIGRECMTVSFSYGQRHVVELSAAALISNKMGAVVHRVIQLDGLANRSSLTGGSEVPKGRSSEEIGKGIPSTYVPGRNTIFAAYALSLAETFDAEEVVLGINAVDYSGYPDCRPEWLEAMQKVADVGTKAGVDGTRVEFVAPLLRMSKADIIRRGVELGVDFGMTRSCYDPRHDGYPCLECDSCKIRREGFLEAGVVDPLSAL